MMILDIQLKTTQQRIIKLRMLVLDILLKIALEILNDSGFVTFLKATLYLGDLTLTTNISY